MRIIAASGTSVIEIVFIDRTYQRLRTITDSLPLEEIIKRINKLAREQPSFKGYSWIAFPVHLSGLNCLISLVRGLLNGSYLVSIDSGMSRLIDRMIAFGSRPLIPSDLGGPDGPPLSFFEEMLDGVDDSDVSPEELMALHKRPSMRQKLEPSSVDTFDLVGIEDVPVIAADEVARFCGEYIGEDMSDVVTTLAPPFDRFWIDIQGVANPLGARAWGVLVEDITSDIEGSGSGEGGNIGWHMMLTLCIEKEKGEVVGPVATMLMALDRDGIWDRNDDGIPTFQGWVARFSEPMPDEIEKEALDALNFYFFPALMTLSFMHCKNVASEEVSPPEKLNKKWSKRHGERLTRFYTLDIDPMGKILKQQGDADSLGLTHSLHICRGHFKRFTEEAPLFGRVTGTFWWADHVRGDIATGEIVKDYRVNTVAPGVGCAYVLADEDVVVTAAGDRDQNAAATERGTRAHNRTQNLLAAALRSAGVEPLSPKPDDPPFDLAFRPPSGLLTVCEVKSLTDANEETQLRKGLGQVLRFRQLLSEGDSRPQALLAVERPPRDAGWLDVCNQSEVILTWPETFGIAVEAIRSSN